MRPLNVLFISHSASNGGAQNCLLYLLQAIDRQKINPLVVLPSRGALETKLTKMRVPFVVAEIGWWLAMTDAVAISRYEFSSTLEARLRRLGEIIANNLIDVVFTNSLVTIDGLLAATLAGKPHVWHVLEMLQRDRDLRPLFDPLELVGTVVPASQGVACVSRSVQEDLQKLAPSSHLEVIHTGIRPQKFTSSSSIRKELAIPESKRVVLFTGLLSARKGVMDLFKAATLVLGGRDDVVFLLAGPDGGQEKALRKALDGSTIKDHFILLGFRTDVPSILHEADIFILPSLSDPLPVAVLEAMHAGKPVIATKSGGCTEMIIDSFNGYLVEVSDVDAMASKINVLLDNPESARALGARSKLRAAEHFSDTTYAERFTKLISDAAQSGKVEIRRTIPPEFLTKLRDTPHTPRKLKLESLLGRIANTIRAYLDYRRSLK